MTPKTLSLSLSLSLLLALAFVFPAAAAVHSRAVRPLASDVDVYFSFDGTPAGVLPGGHVALTGAVRRASVAPAGTDSVDATVTIEVPAAMSNITASGDRWQCSIQSTTVTCTTALFADRNSELLNLGFDVPSSTDGGRYDIKATLATSLPNVYPFPSTQTTVSIPRVLTVTTADDFGAGSLRDALTQANELCDGSIGCTIRFAHAMTIEPTSPLPAITGCNIVIDGGVDYSASLDVERPVEISGAKAGFANGLEVRTPCSTTIQGLTVNRFAANGIVVAPPLQANQVTIESCFIGTDTTASAARPNGMRGIAFETPQSNAQIYNNTISGNRYSGIAIWAASYVFIRSNRIGLGRDSRPLGNGASGVYVDGGQATIFSTIAYNHDFGVGVGPHAVHVDAPADDLFANGVQDVDWGLDGMTPTDPTGRMPPVPVLIDATYDPGKGITTIRGVLPAEGRKNGLYTVRLFKKTPTGTQALWPQIQQPVSGTVDAPFTMTFASDLRGSKIAAQSGIQIFADEFPSDTSELSTPLTVQ